MMIKRSFSAWRLRTTFAFLLTALSSLAPVALAGFPTGFLSQRVLEGLVAPTAVDFAAGDRMFIAYKDGRVRVAINETLLGPVFADYRSQVNNLLDRGLLGLAVHPDFPNEPYVYLAFTYDPPQTLSGQGLAAPDQLGNRVAKVVRLEADPASNFNRMLAGSEVVIVGKNSTWANIGAPDEDYFADVPSCENNGVPVMDCLPQDSNSHSVGDLRFGRDGSLYFSVGDGARASGGTTDIALRSQDIDSLAGKLLRINPLNGEGYATNPFFDGNFNSNRSKVWALGLRNPFRMTVAPDSGDIFIGDVGWGRWEEVDVADVNSGGGLNFGWPCFEGDNNGSQLQGAYSYVPGCVDLLNDGLTASVTAPAFAYPHTGVSSSIQVGDFYVGTVWPGQYQNALFYSDINRRIIRYLSLDANGTIIADNAFATDVPGIAHIRSGPDSNLYYVNIYSGEVRRILYTGGANVPPTAEFDGLPLSGSAPLSVDFDANTSFDPDTNTLAYSWNFGDGDTGNGVEINHVYLTSGEYTATLTVSDSSGATDSTSKVITVGNSAPTVTIDSIANGGGGTSFVVDDTIVATGSAFDAEDGTLNGAALTWNVRVNHNDHFHLDYFNGEGGTVSMPLLDHEDNSSLEICLTATDSGDLTDTACETVGPQEMTLTIDSVPTGLQIAYGISSQTTPFTVTAPIGATRSIGAAFTQGANQFVSWSDGGAAVHDYVIPSNDTTLIATYAGSPASPTLSVTNSSVVESAGPGQFIVNLNPPSSSTVTVRTAARELNATPGVDYYGFFKLLEFLPGETSKTINVNIRDDDVPELDEQLGIRLYNATNASIANSNAELEIIDDDNSGQSAVSVNDVSVSEGAGVGQFVLTLNPPNTSQTVTLYASALTLSATQGADYYGFYTPVSFAPGQTSKTVDVTILEDTLAESDERLGVRLLTVSNAETGDGYAEMTILDNDASGPSQLSVNDVRANENAGSTSFTVSLNPSSSSQTVTVRAAAQILTATPGSDYYGFVKTLTFLPGEVSKTVNVTLLNDTAIEGTEQMGIRLYRSVNADIADSEGVMSIIDDD